MIVNELLSLVETELRKRKVVETRIGLSYTGVLLDNGNMGLAYSFSDEASRCCEVVDQAGDLEGNAWNLAKKALKPWAIDSSVGVATLNAVINKEVEGKRGRLFKFIDLRESDSVGMVGNFRPLVKQLEEEVELFVFERHPSREETYPDWAIDLILPEVDVAIITGTSVVNKTIDHILDLLQNAREIAILGPTTPMASTVFGKKDVTLLGGITIEDADMALKIISQGGGTRKLRTVSNKVTLTL